MAIHQRKQTNVLLTIKVLQFVTQLRRRVEPRTRARSASACQLGLRANKSVVGGPRRTSVRNTKAWHHHGRKRVHKRRKNNADHSALGSELRTPALHVSAAPDTCAEELQHILSSIHQVIPAGHTLSDAAGDDNVFLKHSNAPILEGRFLNQIIRLLVTVQEALDTLTTCRSQHSDEWLVARGLAFGLDIDDVFIANYEHLLRRLQVELVQVLARKALEELLRGGHDKLQRKLLCWFSEFAEKPQLASTSFPWNIKPSLAVLWGVCWMFYNGDSSASDAKADTRVRQERLLQHLDFPSAPWSAPASSDYVNFGLELIGAQPQHSAQQPSQADGTVGLDQVFQARNADTWESDLSPLSFRLPTHEDDNNNLGLIGLLPGQSTYYHHNLNQFPANFQHSSCLPHNPGPPLTVFPHLGAGDSLDDPWQQPPFASLPQRSRRHLIAIPQTPSIRVTGTAGSEIAPPHPDFASLGPLYHQPQASSLQHSTNFNYANLPYNMTSQTVLENTTTQLPQLPVKHERTSSTTSTSNIPTPVSMSGPRSPLLSPTRGEPSHINTSPRTHSHHFSEDRSSQDVEEDGSLRKNFNFKRAEEPLRTPEGKMTCRHNECAGLLFDRKCEWSKHMDKHDRPYKCNVKGCEKLQGFTYSGGLLRHEREVHRMHGGTKKSLFCPFNDCKRSSGAGFTRKENLAEHIRRVHRRTSMSADMHGLIVRRETLEGSPLVDSCRTSESPYPHTVDYRNDDDLASLKRKRGSDTKFSERDNEYLRAEVKRLRQENEEKNSRLHQLEQAVMALQHQTRR
ncbi:hypothetical protein BDU57DRAFT_510429 [Ampelomyces quisqualis]|uniref:C2H2-type domain-containing protein n=1 Tax=Ampelomyces quisqualis TaxID=50730 RepID=A0A6A5R2E0_AMPQU|nr:hypothetical protein BDU57DRAFT_510429 [Ampelomyces quisqualis]